MKKKIILIITLAFLLILILFTYKLKSVSLYEVLSKKHTITSIDNLNCNSASRDFENSINDKLKIQDMFDFFSTIDISETSKLETHGNSNFLFIQLNTGSKCDFCLFIFDQQTIGINNSSEDSIKYYKLKNPIDIDYFKESYLE